MAMRQDISIAILFLLSQMLHETVSHHCAAGGSEKSIFGWKLQGHTYKTMVAKLGSECIFACRRDQRCQSFNFVISVGMCELNDRTKEARPEDFVPDPGRYYYRRAMKRVPLGSIPELQGESCQEIKASEGQAMSGKYWLSTNKPDMPVLAYCDMETGDVDECTASSPVCDVNAICQNTRGSYSCTCKIGFSGDGKTCKEIDECSNIPAPCDVNANCQNSGESYLCSCKPGYAGDGKTCKLLQNSCDKIKRMDSQATDGNFTIFTSSSTLQVYCDMTSSGQGWTLIARFSNDDAENWMNDTGYWWYDRNVSFGSTTRPTSNTDMISPAFWLVSGNDFKITRSDDPQHIALLQTTGNCLGGQTLRSKITSYGDFRNGTVWASNECQGNCTIQYGGQYQTTEGFAQALCSGEIQSANGIGFWCDWGSGDGSVMMIGGGGSSCARADHGIGITEANSASFDGAAHEEGDFGNFTDSGRAGVSTKSYSLNLWIR